MSNGGIKLAYALKTSRSVWTCSWYFAEDGALNEDEQINLVALTWLGRGDDTKEGWNDLIKQASDARNNHAARYLLGIPLLPDYLKEGLSELGYSIEEFETGRL